MQAVTFRPIGTIHSPFKELCDVPIQPLAGRGIPGTIELLPEFVDGLLDLGGFSHVILLFHLHLSAAYQLQVKPYRDTLKRGVFATRAPRRPNPLGLSVVRLERVEGNVLHICDLDIVDGTPLLDIKPYIPALEPDEAIRIGWLEQHVNRASQARADDRYITPVKRES